MANQPYFPNRIGDRIMWLKNYRNKLPNYQAALGYSAPDVTATQADADYIIYLYETWHPATRTFAEGASAYLRQVLHSTGPITNRPEFVLPAAPPAPAAVELGALRRIFGFVKNLKTRAGYTESIGEDLGIIGAESEEDPNAIPSVKHEVRSGEVVLPFRKKGHMGVWIEGQVGDETAWSFLAIDTSNPYNDTRPLKVPGQPETRRYRLCYWDDGPSNAWTNIIEVTFG
ncbi:MAG: hypothetical protein H0U23_00600 [Blastocatellia bacterium]|nr:hypothetical protein [Blastocatellia bacterium]